METVSSHKIISKALDPVDVLELGSLALALSNCHQNEPNQMGCHGAHTQYSALQQHFCHDDKPLQIIYSSSCSEEFDFSALARVYL